MTELWRPECPEDEVLVAFASAKRAFAVGSSGDPGVFPVLHVLASSGASRQGAVAESLGLDASTISRHVRTLVRSGEVTATRDPDDRRATVLTITPAGRAHLVERIRRHRVRLTAALESFTEQERAELARLLTNLAVALSGSEENHE